MSDENKQTQGAVSLVDPGVPADQGLSALGLLMQLGGSLFAAIATLATVMMMLSGGGRGGDKAIILLVLGATITRSVFHRAAGTELLYGSRGLDRTQAPLAGMKRYIVIALAQSALVFLVLVRLQKMCRVVLGACGTGPCRESGRDAQFLRAARTISVVPGAFARGRANRRPRTRTRRSPRRECGPPNLDPK